LKTFQEPGDTVGAPARDERKFRGGEKRRRGRNTKKAHLRESHPDKVHATNTPGDVFFGGKKKKGERRTGHHVVESEKAPSSVSSFDMTASKKRARKKGG